MSQILHIAAILEKKYAISEEDAHLIYPKLELAVKQSEHLKLSFEGIENCSTIFLRNTLGHLYLTFGPLVDKLISFIDISEENKPLYSQLKRLRERALNPEVYQNIYSTAIGES